MFKNLSPARLHHLLSLSLSFPSLQGNGNWKRRKAFITGDCGIVPQELPCPLAQLTHMFIANSQGEPVTISMRLIACCRSSNELPTDVRASTSQLTSRPTKRQNSFQLPETVKDGSMHRHTPALAVARSILVRARVNEWRGFIGITHHTQGLIFCAWRRNIKAMQPKRLRLTCRRTVSSRRWTLHMRLSGGVRPYGYTVRGMALRYPTGSIRRVTPAPFVGFTVTWLQPYAGLLRKV